MLYENSICDFCNYKYCLIKIPECGHLFHFNCIETWPIKNCKKCNINVSNIILLDTIKYDNKNENILRSGKWSEIEYKYINMIIKEFDNGNILCANRLPLRNLLANILNCSLMRISKKFQKKSLKKISFRIPIIKQIDMINTNYLNIQLQIRYTEDKFLRYMKYKNIYIFINFISYKYKFWKNQFLLFAKNMELNIIGYNFHLIKTKKRKPILIKSINKPYVYNSKKTKYNIINNSIKIDNKKEKFYKQLINNYNYIIKNKDDIIKKKY